jgi:hypothetical protein
VVVTGGDGRAEVEAPLGKATVSAGESFSEVVWIGEGRTHDLEVVLPVERGNPESGVPTQAPFS